MPMTDPSFYSQIADFVTTGNIPKENNQLPPDFTNDNSIDPTTQTSIIENPQLNTIYLEFRGLSNKKHISYKEKKVPQTVIDKMQQSLDWLVKFHLKTDKETMNFREELPESEEKAIISRAGKKPWLNKFMTGHK